MHAAYLYTDVEDSTPRWEKKPAAMRAAMARHKALIKACVNRHGGRVHDAVADSVFAIFPEGEPLACALDIQMALQEQDWADVGGLSVRIGVHVGPMEADEQPDEVTANRTERITSCAWGGQIVVSADAYAMLAPPRGASFASLGACRLRGVLGAIRLFGLTHPLLNRTEFPPPRVADFDGSPPPARNGPLYGRERELDDICALVMDVSVRHVTIVGAGGNGKTRLATEVAHRLGDEFAIIYVALDPNERESLFLALARVLTFPFDATSPHQEQLIDYLREKRGLLIIDNAESAKDGEGFLDRLIVAAPEIKVLAAGRAPLQSQCERLYQLGGLQWAGADPEAVRRSAAFAFFAQEAERFGGDVTLDDGAAAAFQAICEQVRGSPLALQLAARWRRMLSIQDILARLQNGMRFLAEAPHPGAGDDALRQVFETSWTLLSTPMQDALARLSVFHDGFEADVADRVAQCPLSVLGELELRGLVEKRSMRRFSLHPLICEYARERLDDRAFAAATRLQHCRHYLEVLSSDANFAAVLNAVEHDNANLKAAWAYAVAIDDDGLVRSAIEPLFYGAVMRSRYADALQILAVRPERGELQYYCRALASNCLVHIGEVASARVEAEAVLAGAHEPLARAHAHQALGNIEHLRHAFEAASRHYEAALALRAREADNVGQFYTYLSLAALYVLSGEHARARALLKIGHRIALRVGLKAGLINVHLVSGDLAVAEGRLEDARGNYLEALKCEEAVGIPQFRCRALSKLGAALSQMGSYAAACACHREALAIAEARGDLRGKVMALIEVARSDAGLGDFETARADLLLACRDSLKLQSPGLVAAALRLLAEVERAAGNLALAERLTGLLEEESGEQPPASGALEALHAAAEDVLLEAEHERMGL